MGKESHGASHGFARGYITVTATILDSSDIIMQNATPISAEHNFIDFFDDLTRYNQDSRP